MRRIRSAVLIGLALVGQILPAQVPGPAATSSGRYLLIVETSSSMRRRAQAVQETVRTLLRSDMNGQLRSGDTLGVWTFNEELYAGRLSLQLWTPGRREVVAQNIIEFLKQQSCEKQARLENVVPELAHVIKSSGALTVLLISAGEKEIRGTPFDRQINAAYLRWRHEMRRTQQPFITVLRARNGQLTGHTVNMAPWPVEFPAFPPEPKAIAATPPPEVSAREAEPDQGPKRAAPIILDLSKSPTEPAEKASQTEVAKAGEASPPVTTAPTPLATTSGITAPEVDNAEMSAVAPAPIVSVPAPKAEPPPVVPSPAPAPSPVTAPAVTGVPPTVDVAVEAGPRQQSRQEQAKVETEPVKVQSAKLVAPLSEEPVPSSPALKAPELVAPPNLEVQPATTLAVMPEPVSLPADSGASVHSPTVIPVPPALVPGQTAVTTPAGVVSSSRTLLIGAAVLLATVAGLFLLLLRRARSAPGASLITRSMDRKQD